MNIIADILDPALKLLPANMDSMKARAMLLAIGFQESGFKTRTQITNGGGIGPARSYWQFEENGGVKGVLNHPASKLHAQAVCKARGVEPEKHAVWLAMATDDILGASMARLLLWTDPQSLPELTAPIQAWDCYIRNWRPGKPHFDRWDDNHRRARELLMLEAQ